MKTTDAVKTKEQAERVKTLLTLNAKGSTLYADIWTFGIQVALRISDLLSSFGLPLILLAWLINRISV